MLHRDEILKHLEQFGRIVIMDRYQDDYAIYVKREDMPTVADYLRRNKVKMADIEFNQSYNNYVIDFTFGVQ